MHQPVMLGDLSGQQRSLIELARQKTARMQRNWHDKHIRTDQRSRRFRQPLSKRSGEIRAVAMLQSQNQTTSDSAINKRCPDMFPRPVVGEAIVARK